MMRKILAGLLTVAALAAWTNTDRTPSAVEPSATIERTSSEDGDQRKICVCRVYGGYMYCFGNSCR